MEKQEMRAGDVVRKIERRKIQRFRSRIEVHFCIKGDKGNQWKGVYAKDISITGLSFIYQEPLPLSSKLEIRISIPRLREEIRLDGKIVRMEDLDVKGYLYEVEYEGINADIQEIIRKKIELTDLNKLLKMVAEKGASDLHLCVNTPPFLRIGGNLSRFDMEPLNREDLEDLIYNILSEEQIKKLHRDLELDSSHELDGHERFRFNIHFQRGNMEATFRRIYTEHKTIEELGLPGIVGKFALSSSGLVVLTGKTNNGKTTTAVAMIDLINETKNAVIVTVEDPIEHILINKKSIIKQREVGIDTKSFATATREALRQDIDVLFIGEILDPDTLLVALRAAEVGHLVILTFPAQDAAQAVERMIFSVPSQLQYQIRIQLSNTLLGMVSQKLFPSLRNPHKRVVATEVLVNTSAVANVIREANMAAIRTAIQTGAAAGMHTMRSSVELLCARRQISLEALKELEMEEHSFVK